MRLPFSLSLRRSFIAQSVDCAALYSPVNLSFSFFLSLKSQHGAPPRDVGDPVQVGHARHLPGGIHAQVPLREGLHPREGGRQRRQGHDQEVHHLRQLGWTKERRELSVI